MSEGKVAVLGPAGTFSEVSAKKMFPQSDLVHKPNVAEVFNYVEDGRGLGVVAAENNLEGSVG
ncbi:MAG: prephenate dehydratase, partial [Candidatus Altiarchaeales archaeon]|nr:prephenate dehydratase [Candidatus Altiarchaeales archaeon]